MIDKNATILGLFCRRVAQDGGRNAIHIKRDGQYAALTWDEVGADVRRAAVALRRVGAAPGDRVVQVSENRYEWIVTDLAVQMAGAVHTPVHAPLTGPQIAWQIRHSEAKVVLLSGAEQAEKLAAVAEQIPPDVQFFAFDPCEVKIGSRPVGLWSDVGADAADDECRDVEEQGLNAVTPDSLATILYTSGTTGEPKGVMLSQRNLASNTLATLEAFGERSDDLRLNFLPLSHIFARTCDMNSWLSCGSQLALAESRETVIADCAAVKPTLINGVPYFYDKVRRHLCDNGLADQEGVLQAVFGGNIRLCCSGGAALPDHVYDFYWERGVPLLQGYGLSESSPVITVSTEEHHRRGAVGQAIPGVEVRIADDGEILTRGPHVMLGYWKNPQATEEVTRDGWLVTGDLGRLDEDGFLYITGRKKEIIVTAGGKNVAPAPLESLLCEDPLILQALVVGDGRNYLAALVVPNPETLREELASRGIAVSSPQDALAHPDVRALFEERIAARLACVSHYEQVRKFTLLSRGFTIESGELTPKLSLRRKEIEEHFAKEIAAMYEQ
ncbi:MAG: AMP-dependent synthetase/ligase [Planctomycetes bacterium]|nr:AMP-dependent synthetase/ligase [Planctomycetota bacterium]